MSDKPPLGLRPRWLVLEERHLEIRNAINSYDERALLAFDQWLLELKEIEDQLAELRQPKPVDPEPVDAEFTPTAAEILELIRTGAAPFYVVVVSDDNPRGPGGEPIVWEHPLPRETTLRAALKRRDSIGSRYGTTFIAECRIIPELTREVRIDV